jgi:hypothetical protein
MTLNIQVFGKMSAEELQKAFGDDPFTLNNASKSTSGDPDYSEEREAAWLKSWDAKECALAARQAAAFARVLAESEFQSKRAELIRAAAQALQEDPKAQGELKEALKVPAQLVELRDKLCQSLAAASAQVK